MIEDHRAVGKRVGWISVISEELVVSFTILVITISIGTSTMLGPTSTKAEIWCTIYGPVCMNGVGRSRTRSELYEQESSSSELDKWTTWKAMKLAKKKKVFIKTRRNRIASSHPNRELYEQHASSGLNTGELCFFQK